MFFLRNVVYLFIFTFSIACNTGRAALIDDGREALQLVDPPANRVEQDGVAVAERGKECLIILPDNADNALRIAAEELAKYLKIAVGAHTKIADKPGQAPFAILLGNERNNRWIAQLGVTAGLADAGAEGFAIWGRRDAFRKGQNVAVIRGGNGISVRNGAYGFLRRAVDAAWFPPRIYYPKDRFTLADGGYRLETYMERRDKVKMPNKPFVDKPKLRDRGVYVFNAPEWGRFFQPAVVDWCLKNRINLIVVCIPYEFPMSAKDSEGLKAALKRTREVGIPVFFLSFTHSIDRGAATAHPEILKNGKVDPTEPTTKRASVELFTDIARNYDIDGLVWHPATEGIEIATEKLKGRPRHEIEADYFRAYVEGVRKVKPSMQFAMVVSWDYMNPAEKLAEVFPRDMIAWVPHLEDAKEYRKHFPRCWAWAYPSISCDGPFPAPRLASMKAFVTDACQRDYGMVPEVFLYSHVVNIAYLIESGWRGPLPIDDFLAEFCGKYYGADPRPLDGLELYTEVFSRYEGWYTNPHIRLAYWREHKIAPDDQAKLIKAYGLFRDAYRESENPMVRSRLKEMALSSLRLVPRGEIEPEKMSAMFAEAAEIFKDHWLGPETDFFYADLREQMGEARHRTILADLNAGKVVPPRGLSVVGEHWRAAAITGNKHSAYRISFPAKTPAAAGDFAQVSRAVELPPGAQNALLRFTINDDIDQHAEYIFEQVVVNGQVVWERDAAGSNDAGLQEIDVSKEIVAKTPAEIAFRVVEKKGVSNWAFSVWYIDPQLVLPDNQMRIELKPQ
ncbi:MAG: hypothetical protein JW959_04975 [Pirellulales bacterium]|nr:hypothetical protein [Pirellulales bacterium]